MEATSGAFQWLANSFYVLVALAVVYLYFFKIVPLVAGKVNVGSLGGVIQLTLILIVVAILIGFVAVRTADWIFINVLDSLPGTRIAEEIDRVTGPMVELPVTQTNRGLLNIPPASIGGSTSTSASSSGTASTASSNSVNPAPAANSASASPPPAIILKDNAMSIWAGRIQSIYNPTGSITDNGNEMSAADIPTGVTCQVYATQPSRIWRTRANEPWTLSCSNDDSKPATNIMVNGTAARGLTGGGFYDSSNKVPVYGGGPWPTEAIERTVVPEAPGSSRQGNSAPAAAPAVSTPAGGPAASTTAGLTVENGQRMYTVKNGDSLARIAETYDLQVSQIVNANATRYPQMANNNNFISPGWKLVLP